MKKAILIILAVAFVCTVYCAKQKLVDGESVVYFDERFSVQKWINNLMALGEGESIQDLTACWTEDSYTEKVDLPIWEHIWLKTEYEDGSYDIWYHGYYPLAYSAVGNEMFTDRYPYDFVEVYYENGVYRGTLPVVRYTEQTTYYEDYGVEDEQGIKQFFVKVSGFFHRLGRTIVLFVEIVLNVFKNLGKLLPWNATVPILEV